MAGLERVRVDSKGLTVRSGESERAYQHNIRQLTFGRRSLGHCTVVRGTTMVPSLNLLRRSTHVGTWYPRPTVWRALYCTPVKKPRSRALTC